MSNNFTKTSAGHKPDLYNNTINHCSVNCLYIYICFPLTF